MAATGWLVELKPATRSYLSEHKCCTSIHLEVALLSSAALAQHEPKIISAKQRTRITRSNCALSVSELGKRQSGERVNKAAGPLSATPKPGSPRLA